MSLFKKPRDTVCINFHPHFLWILSTVVDVIRLVVSTLSNMYEVSLPAYWALSAILSKDTWVSVSVTSLLCFRDSVTNIRSAPVWGLHQGSSRCVKKKHNTSVHILKCVIILSVLPNMGGCSVTHLASSFISVGGAEFCVWQHAVL